MYDRLSSICSILLIPDNTVITPSKFATNFIAHDAIDIGVEWNENFIFKKEN